MSRGWFAACFSMGMREPFISEALENGPDATDTVKRDPSYPDRARIDSDVRAFLRPVSTPWIVFDRDSRVDDFAKSALRIGAVFASSPSFRPEVIKAAEESGRSLAEVVAMPLPGLAPLEPARYREDPFRTGAVLSPATSSMLADSGVFPPASSSSHSVSVVEPSNVVVATDVAADSSSIDARRPTLSPSATRSRFLAKSGRIAAVALACAGVVALVGVSAVTLARGGRLQSKAAAPAAAQAVQAPVVPAVEVAMPSPVETVELDAVPAPAPSAEVAVAAPAKVSAEPKKRFGRLSIRSEARYKNVWFDGKRMLGTGQRSFLVFCGMHTIAVADKTDTKDVEIPCDGEYSVSR